MANERNKRLMQIQEALDGVQSADTMRELRRQLDSDEAESAAFERLRKTDQLLRVAPTEAAPEGMALKILTRLAERLNPRLLHETSPAVALGLAAVALILTPLLAVVGWLAIAAVSSAAILGSLVDQVITILAALMNLLESLVAGARDIMATSPEAAVLLMALIPIAVLWLVRFRWDDLPDDDVI